MPSNTIKKYISALFYYGYFSIFIFFVQKEYNQIVENNPNLSVTQKFWKILGPELIIGEIIRRFFKMAYQYYCDKDEANEVLGIKGSGIFFDDSFPVLMSHFRF